MRRSPSDPSARIGTVGCVALDGQGNLAAGTSTGGLVNKLFGRIGDSPIIGAGTYADIAEGIIWATDNGAHVINLGFGGTESSMALETIEVWKNFSRQTAHFHFGGQKSGQNIL